MKPRIKKVGVFWACAGIGGIALGYTPHDAYENWVINPQVLFANAAR